MRPCFLDAPLWTLRRARPLDSLAPPPGGLDPDIIAPSWKKGGGRSLDPPGRGVCDTKVLLCDKTVRDDRNPLGVYVHAERVGAG